MNQLNRVPSSVPVHKRSGQLPLVPPHGAGATYITAADSGILDINDHVVIALQLRDGAVFEFDLVDALQDEGKVLYTTTLMDSLQESTQWSSPYLSRCGSHVRYLKELENEEEKNSRK